MIKKIHQVTLKDVILLDATKSASHLKKYWFIPIYFLRSQLELLAKQIFKSIGSETVDELQNAIERLLSYRRLQILEALYNAVRIEFEIKSKINVFKIIMSKDFAESPHLEEVLKEVKNHTGIEINSIKDYNDFKEYIDFRIDKHKETYPEIKPDEQKKEVKLQKVLYSVFNYMGEPYNENMRLITFIELKAIAEDRIKQAQIQQENGSIK